MDEDRRNLIVERLQMSPFHQWLGLELADCGEGWVEIAMPWRDELISSPEPPTLHGGISASLIDMAGLSALRAAGVTPVGTIYMHADYHRAGRPGPLLARSEVVRAGRSMGIADTRVSQDGKLIASGRGGYRIKSD